MVNADPGDLFDVAILGTGFEGGLLGTILGHQGVKVLMIDAGQHPRFALGESTVRHTFKMLKIIGDRYHIPEIEEKFSRAALLHEHVTSSGGEKRNFGFLYHREGQDQDPAEANQLAIAPFREGYEAHLYRQDIDAWLTYTAVHYGAVVKYKTMLSAVDFASDGVTITSSTNETFRARYIVDASGPSAVLARLLDLREKPPRLKLNTRCLFTHMIDVKEYDDLPLPRGVPKMPERWYNGTCHHIFDGGWIWVIPFNNRKGWTNPAVSVGLSFDNVRFPRPTDITPEQEWEQFLSRFPSIQAQFKDAKAIREWVSTDRLQTSCSRATGDRFCLTAAAYGSGFLDALFSRGLSNSVEIISALVPRLLSALKDDDFAPERFEYLERAHRNNLYHNDKLVNACYIAFQNYHLWDCMFRLWAIGVGLGDLRLASILRTFAVTRDESVLPDSAEPMGLFFSNHLGYKALFEAVTAKVEAVGAGELPAEEAANEIYQLYGAIDFVPPVLRFGDPERRFINVGDRATLLRTAAWAFTAAPPEIKQLTVDSIRDIGPLRFLLGKPKITTTDSKPVPTAS
jgi:FADH2 O2-dependent halogenase